MVAKQSVLSDHLTRRGNSTPIKHLLHQKGAGVAVDEKEMKRVDAVICLLQINKEFFNFFLKFDLRVRAI
jgi:hypothetical protein